MNQILIIDDTHDLRELLKVFFEAKGYEVLEASSGKAGLEIISAKKPSLVITDIIMPDMNGIDVIKEVRRKNKRLPVIAMSGYQDELGQVERLGVNATFIKPPNLEEMGHLVNLLVQKKSA